MWETYTESNTTFGELLDLSGAEEYSCIALQFLLFFIGVIGNSLVLYASLKYKAVSLDRTTVILIENIATTDLAIVIIAYGVISVNLVCGRWVFGDHLCFILGYTKHVFFVAEFCFIVLIGLCRLHCLLRPMAPLLTTTTTKSVVLFIWIASTLYVATWPFTAAGMFYGPLISCCMPVLNPTANYIFMAFHFVIMTAIFVTNVAILLVAKRYSTDNKSVRKAVLTVSTVCWVFIGSYCPWLCIYLLEGAQKHVPMKLIAVGGVSIQINLLANPFIYSFTNRRFYIFLKGLFIRSQPPKRGALPKEGETVAGTTKEMSTKGTTSTGTRKEMSTAGTTSSVL